MIAYVEINSDYFRILKELVDFYDGHFVGFTVDDMREIYAEQDKFSECKSDLDKVIFCACYHHKRRSYVQEIKSEFDMNRKKFTGAYKNNKFDFEDYKDIVDEMKAVDKFMNNFKIDKMYVGYEVLDEFVKITGNNDVKIKH